MPARPSRPLPALALALALATLLTLLGGLTNDLCAQETTDSLAPTGGLTAPLTLEPSGSLGADSLDLHGSSSLNPDPGTVLSGDGPDLAPAPVLAPAASQAVPSPAPARSRKPLTIDLLAPEAEAPADSEPVSGDAAPQSAPSATVRDAGASAPTMQPSPGRGDAGVVLLDEADAATTVEELAAAEPESPMLDYLTIIIGLILLFFFVLALVIAMRQSKEKPRSSRRKRRRRQDDAALKQRTAMSPRQIRDRGENGGAGAAPHPAVPEREAAAAPYVNRRRTQSRGATTNGQRSSAPTRAETAEEYAQAFEHMVRMNRLREDEPDPKLDRMTLAELHMHYNALLKIAPAAAREEILGSVETLMDELTRHTREEG